MAYRWGIQNCCIPYDSFPISLNFTDAQTLMNSGIVTAGNTYYFTSVSFDTPQTFYKPDGTTYTPHCWSMVYQSWPVGTAEVTNFTWQAPGSYLHPKTDCAEVIAYRLNLITNFPNVYGTQPCCPQGTPPVMNGVRSCCKSGEQYTVDPAYPLNKQVGEAFWGSFSIWVNNVEIFPGFGCWEAIDDAVGPMMGNGAFGPAFPDCQSIVIPPSSTYPPCCPPVDECDSHRLVPLQNTIDTFKISRDSVLNPGDKPPPVEDWKDTSGGSDMDWAWEKTKKKKTPPVLAPEEDKGGKGGKEGRGDVI